VKGWFRLADIVSPEVRSRMMSGIKSKNTKPEMVVRSALHRRGFRFRLHDKKLPGSPDLVFPKFHAALFVNGCFWHGHDCHLFRLPKTRTDFWHSKIMQNRARDEKVRQQLSDIGFRHQTVWECELKNKPDFAISKVLDGIEKWLTLVEGADT